MSSEPTYFAVLPAEVRYDKNLSSLEKLLYAEITALSNKEGFCWASNGYFASLYDRQPTYISKVFAKLAKGGYIRIEIDQAAGNQRKIFIGLAVKNDTYSEKVQEGYSDLVQPNSINNNTKVNTITNNRTSQDDTDLTELLLRHVADNYPFLKDKPYGIKDYQEMNKIHRLDGHEYSMIKFIIEWSQKDTFWCQQIRSVAGLRKKFDTLMVQASSDLKQKSNVVVSV